MLAPEMGNVVRLSDYRSRSDVPSAPPSDPDTSEVLAKLARCDHFIYAGTTPDGMVHFGRVGFHSFTTSSHVRGVAGSVSDFDYEAAGNLRDAAVRLLGRLQEIIDAGDRQ